MSKRANHPYRREHRREAAEERREVRESRSSQEQLRLLDSKFGKNQGAKRERQRLTSS